MNSLSSPNPSRGSAGAALGRSVGEDRVESFDPVHHGPAPVSWFYGATPGARTAFALFAAAFLFAWILPGILILWLVSLFEDAGRALRAARRVRPRRVPLAARSRHALHSVYDLRSGK